VAGLCAPTRSLSLAPGSSRAMDPLEGRSPQDTPTREGGGRGYESRGCPRGLSEAVRHRPRACETRALRWGICGGNPLDSDDTTPGRSRGGGWVSSSHVTRPRGGVTRGAPSGGRQEWSSTTYVTPPPGGVSEGASPDQAPKGPDTDGRGASPFDLGPLEGPGSLWKFPHPGRDPEPRSDLGQRRYSPRISIRELKNLGSKSPGI